jgi:hypothetical protein
LTDDDCGPSLNCTEKLCGAVKIRSCGDTAPTDCP